MTPVLNLLYTSTAMSASGMTDMIAAQGVSVFTWTPFSPVGSLLSFKIQVLRLYESWSGPFRFPRCVSNILVGVIYHPMSSGEMNTPPSRRAPRKDHRKLP